MNISRQKYILSQDFIQKLFEISAGYLPHDKFEKIIILFEAEVSKKYFSHTSEANLLRIILAMYDKISFINECLNYPHYVEVLVSISNNSNYLTDILVRNPEYFYLIINPSNLNLKIEPKTFSESLNKSLVSYKSFSAKLNALKSIKRKETLRIGTKDIFVNTDLIEVSSELSVLAKSITAKLFEISYQKILSKYNIEQIDRKYSILALGKLGGDELNYSSDIDLIIFYDSDEELKNKKYYSEILIEAIYLFIESASAITESGYIYRVDFRLRPDGRNSPLCRSLPEYLNYYESRGEDWERQMLIKASFVNGDYELYKEFINFLTPFIYPSLFSISPTEQIKRLKENIERANGADDNIKLVAGGIRDVEFSVQALQLINGGKDKNIRSGNTLFSINKLNQADILNNSETEILTIAYVFYRKIEHYLQLMNDTQTHSIPSEGELLEKLSSYLGFKSSTDFKAAVMRNRSKVIKIYNSIMGIRSGTRQKKVSYSNINFANRNKALKDLDYLREGKGLLGQKEFDKKSIEYFEKIESILIKYLETAVAPDIILQNFVRIIRNTNFPSIWFKEFLNKKFFKLFLALCEFNQKAVDLFSEDDELREFFITRQVFEKLGKKDLSKFTTKKIIFALSVQFMNGIIKADDVSKFLRKFILLKIQEIIDNSDLGKDYNFFVAAMGSFGSGEMTFASDIDLIFTAEKFPNEKDIQKDFQNLLSEIKNTLFPFTVDCRLRPEGKSSLLIWEIQKYEEYLESRARIWELQAFTKLSFINGKKSLFNRFVNAIEKRIKSEENSRITKEICDMRKKLYPQVLFAGSSSVNLKKGRGGLADIDFLLQNLILCNPAVFKKTYGKGSLKILDILIKNSIKVTNTSELIFNFRFLKKLEITNQLIFNITQSTLPGDKQKLLMLSNFLGYKSQEDLQAKIKEITSLNNSVFQKYLDK